MYYRITGKSYRKVKQGGFHTLYAIVLLAKYLASQATDPRNRLGDSKGHVLLGTGGIISEL